MVFEPTALYICCRSWFCTSPRQFEANTDAEWLDEAPRKFKWGVSKNEGAHFW